MKFVQKKQFNDYFYNKNIEYKENVNDCMHMRARDIFMHLKDKKMLSSSILFIIGPGNNGKLALEIARICAFSHIRIHLLITQNIPTKDDILTLFKHEIDYLRIYSDIQNPAIQSLLENNIQIIDGLFATGISSELDSHYSTIINQINSYPHNQIISLTLPSGMQNINSSDNVYIHANFVVTLDVALVTLLTNAYPISQIICIPSSQKNKHMALDSTISSTRPKAYKPTLTAKSHKHNRGNILSFGGIDYFGAGILALRAMQKINACTIHHFSNVDGKFTLLSAIPEILFHPLTDSVKEILPKPSVAVLGFGVHGSSALTEHYHSLLSLSSFSPIILDAGALELLTLEQSSSEKHPLIITPHLGEFARMNNTSVKEIINNRIVLASHFAKKNNVILVLKGDQTIVTDGTSTWINPAGNPLLATPGSGDVLAGVIAAHIDFTTTPENLFSRVCQAVYRHSFAADKLSSDHANITASMLIEHL